MFEVGDIICDRYIQIAIFKVISILQDDYILENLTSGTDYKFYIRIETANALLNKLNDYEKAELL